MRNSILIVDDIKSNLILLDKILTDEGYKVISADNGDEAIKSVQENEFDLILLDIMMPKKNGFMVFEELKENERSANIPVIFITVINNDSDTLKAFEMGAVDYIAKPFTPTELRIRVRTQIALVNANKSGDDKIRFSVDSKQNITNAHLVSLSEKLILIENQIQNLKHTQFNTQEKARLVELTDLATEIASLLQYLSK